MSAEHLRRLAQIAVVWRAGVGPVGFQRLLGQFGSPETILRASREELAQPVLRLDPTQIDALLGRARALDRIESALEKLSAQSIRVFCDFEPDYPELLHDLRDRPPVLCVAGRLLPTDSPAVTLVGTRRPTPEGLRLAEELACGFARESVTVVSGLALGCDTAAHWGALRGGGRSVAVLGSGILSISPRENLELARRLAENGAVLSELSPVADPSSAHLLARNRLQAALGQVLIVVQSGLTGGAMHTAERALHTGRPVYAVSWPQSEERAAGAARLLELGAQPLGGPSEIPNLVRELFVQQEKYRRERALGRTQMQLFPPAQS